MADYTTLSNDDLLALKRGDYAAVSDAALQQFRPPKTPTDTFAQQTAARPAADRFVIGMGQGMTNAARQAGNIAGLISDEEMEGYRQLDRPLLDTDMGGIGAVSGEIAALAPLAGGLVGAVSKLVGKTIPALKGATTGPRWTSIGSGAGRGGAEGALEGAVLAGPGNRLEGASSGLGFGVGLGGAIPMAARGVRTPTPEAQTIRDMGVNVDVGRMKPKGMANQLLELSTNVPFTGAMVRQGRANQQDEWVQAMINEGRPPNTPKIKPGDPSNMLEEAYMAFEPAYAPFKGISLEKGALDDITEGLADSTRSGKVIATPTARGAVKRFLDDQAAAYSGRDLTTDDLFRLRSTVREAARKKSGGDSQSEMISDLLDQAEGSLTDRINNALPKWDADEIKKVDLQYAKHKITEDALTRAGDKTETPFKFSQAIKKATDSGVYAKGGGLLRDKVKAANKVFEQVTPETGARAIGAGILAGGAASIPSMISNPLAAAALLGPAVLSASRMGRNLPVGDTALQQLMQRVSRPRNFMDTGVPVLPGMYTRALGPSAGVDRD